MDSSPSMPEQLFELACRIVESDADESVLQLLRESAGEDWVNLLLSTYQLHKIDIQDSRETLVSIYAGARCLLENCKSYAPTEDHKIGRAHV